MLSCYIIGEDTITQECAKILLKRGWLIAGVITEKYNLKQWAKSENIPVIESIDIFCDQVKKGSFDFLFSIVNAKILSSVLLEYPAQMAINFHSSFLPQYGGLHGPCHALLNNEKMYGITWHKMIAAIDAGLILQQEVIPIEPIETSYSLFLKCAKIAPPNFETLLQKLETNSYPTQFQPDSSDHTDYYSSATLPSSLGMIDWSGTAESIDQLCRALYFGTLNNPFFLPKIKCADELYFISEITLTSSISAAAPGTLVEILPTELVIATATKEIKVSKIMDEWGAAQPVSTLQEKNRLTPGSCFLDSSLSDKRQLYYAAFQQAIKNEKFWIQQYDSGNFLQFTPLPKEYTTPILANEDAALFNGILFSMYDAPVKHILLGIVIVYLYRIMEQAELTILLEFTKDNDYLQHVLPFHISLEAGSCFTDVLKKISAQEKVILKKGKHLKEFFLKYPALQALQTTLANTACIRICDKPILEKIEPHHAITITLSPAHRQIYIAAQGPFLLDNMYTHLQTIGNAFIKEKDQSIDTVFFLTPSETQQLLSWNNIHRDYPQKSLYDLFIDQVNQRGNSIALYYEETKMTYSMLHKQAENLSWSLKKHLGGKQKNEIIAVCLPRSPELIITMIALIQRGSIILPIEIDAEDPQHKKKKIARYHPRALISKEKNLYTELSASHILSEWSELCLAEIKTDFMTHEENLPEAVLLTTTSGTTGTPKGVLTRQTGWTNWSHYLRELQWVSEQDIVYVSSPITFDAAFWEIFCLGLTQGAALILNSEAERLSAMHLKKLFSKHHVTLATFTPSFLTTLKPYDFPTLKRIFAIGETLKERTIQPWLDTVDIINGYGPSEASAGSTLVQCQQGSPITIGRAISNTGMYILDHKKAMMPVGVWGEIYITGVGLSPGYIGCSEKENERFVQISLPGSMVNAFRTGDRARVLPDGNIEFGGRIQGDRQIKIQGVRVEIEPIERCLYKHPAIHQAFVCATGLLDQQQLIAYIVTTRESHEPTAEYDFQDYLIQQGFSAVNIPRIYYYLKEMPLDKNGKCDVKKLLTMELESGFDSKNTSPYFDTLNTFEKELIKLWEKIFPSAQNKIRMHTSFKEIGGTSFLLFTLIQSINQHFFDQEQTQITIADLSRHFTVADCAAIIQKKQEKNTVSVATSRESLFANYDVTAKYAEENIQEDELVLDFYY